MLVLFLHFDNEINVAEKRKTNQILTAMIEWAGLLSLFRNTNSCQGSAGTWEVTGRSSHIKVTAGGPKKVWSETVLSSITILFCVIVSIYFQPQGLLEFFQVGTLLIKDCYLKRCTPLAIFYVGVPFPPPSPGGVMMS